MSTYTKKDLIEFKPQHDYFVGIDSDGCVFDTMEVKQKQHFHPLIMKSWGLEQAEKELRECAEFVNLYSQWRGQNRFPALLRSLELLVERPEFINSGLPAPALDAMRTYCESGVPMSNATLKETLDKLDDAELKRLHDWSLAVNQSIADTMGAIAPFKYVHESLERMKPLADLVVVSQTPEEALVHEWDLHDIHQHVHVIAGQELGTKSEHLQMATEGRYEENHVLMIGDAPGDRKAAEAVNALFYPINPGREEASWQQFYEEAFDRFIAGTYAGEYQDKCIAEFDALLPAVPPWKS